MSNILFCNLCKQPGNYVCQRCKDGYCSANCQKLDWPNHKTVCIPMPALVPAPNYLLKSPNKETNYTSVTDSVWFHSKEIVDKSALSFSPNTKYLMPDVKEFCDGENLISNDKDLEKIIENRKWLTISSLPENEFFDVVVRHNDSENIIWVVNASLLEALDSLFNDMNNKTVTHQQCSQNDLLFGEIYCVQYKDSYYRGIIIKKLCENFGNVIIRLIDCGTSIETSIESIKHLMEQHKSVNAFAFPISTDKKLSVGERAQIKILEKINNVYSVKLKNSIDTENFHSILDDLRETAESSDGKICIKKFFSKNKFLTVTTTLTAKLKFDKAHFQKSCFKNLYMSNPNLKIEPYMAGLTAEGFQRGKVLAFYENLYVFVSIDDASYNLVNCILTIEESFEQYPITVTICEIESVSDDESFHKSFYKNNCLAVKVTDKTNEFCKINILVNNKILATGKLKKWNYSLSELNLNCWTIDAKSGTSVHITCVHDYNTFSICPKEFINTYENIFEDIYRNAEIATEYNENILYFYLNKHNKPFRGISTYRDTDLFLVDLDTGINVKVNNYKHLKRILNDFVITAPVFTRKVQIKNFSSVVTPNIMQLVNNIIMEGGHSFTLKYDNDDIDGGCDLINEEGKSIVALVSEYANECSNEEKLSTVPIPIGSDVELFILDTSQLESGIITACINDTQMISVIMQNDIKITEYCAAQPKDGFRPNIDELCLSKFAKDNRWYRTLCLTKTTEDNYLVLFIDYGNIDTVSYKNILKITSNFLYPSLAQTCVINDFTVAKLEKAKQLFTAARIKKVDRIEKSNDCFLIFVYELSN